MLFNDAVHRWDMPSVSERWMSAYGTLALEHLSNWNKSGPSATLSTTNPTGTGHELNSNLHGVRLVNNLQSHGTDWRLLGTQILCLYSPRPGVNDKECRKLKKMRFKDIFPTDVLKLESNKVNKSTVEWKYGRITECWCCCFVGNVRMLWLESSSFAEQDISASLQFLHIDGLVLDD